MDRARLLDVRLQPSPWDTTKAILTDMATRLKMPKQWMLFLVELRKFYLAKRHEYKEAGGSPSSIVSDPGGLTDYEGEFEKHHKEFGSLADGPSTFEQLSGDALKLEYETGSDERPDASDTNHKSESTPAQTPGFTSVNSPSSHEPIENSRNETYSLSPRTQVSGPRFPGISSSSSHSSHPYATYNTPVPQAVPHPATPLSRSTSSFYTDLSPINQTLQTVNPSYQGPHTVSGSGYTSYAAPPFFNPQMLQNLYLQGGNSIDMSDVTSMQAADDLPIGNMTNNLHCFSDNIWIEQVYEEAHPEERQWADSQYNQSYSNMGRN